MAIDWLTATRSEIAAWLAAEYRDRVIDGRLAAALVGEVATGLDWGPDVASTGEDEDVLAVALDELLRSAKTAAARAALNHAATLCRQAAREAQGAAQEIAIRANVSPLEGEVGAAQRNLLRQDAAKAAGTVEGFLGAARGIAGIRLDASPMMGTSQDGDGGGKETEKGAP